MLKITNKSILWNNVFKIFIKELTISSIKKETSYFKNNIDAVDY